jgi:YVTN family beta-propeller protein
MKRLVFCAVLFFLCAGCYAPVSTVKPALTEEGEIFLYLEPFTPDARALRFTLEQVAAVRSDGTEAPLTLHHAEIKGDDSSRQRLLASGVLPPGGYLGFSVKLRQASLTNEQEEKPLLVSDKPERVSFPFEVKRKKGTLFSLTLAYREAVRSGSSFRSAFTVVVPPSPLITLTGYVTNTGSNTVTVFDKRGGSVRRVIATGLRPMGMALDQKKMVAYVAISGEDAIEVIDLLSNEIVNRIRLTYGDRPGEIALTPDGKTLLVVNTGSNTVSFVDPATLLEIARLTVGNLPRSILLDPTGKKGYVFNYLSNTINVIDIANRTLFPGTIPTESGPLRGAFSRLGDKLMVIHEWSPNLIVIDPVSSTIVKRVYVGLGSGTLRVDTTTDRIYLSMRHDPVMPIYDPFSLIPGDFLNAAGGADYMLFDGETSNFLLVLPDQKALQAVNLISKKGEYLIDVGEEPFWSAIMGER